MAVTLAAACGAAAAAGCGRTVTAPAGGEAAGTTSPGSPGSADVGEALASRPAVPPPRPVALTRVTVKALGMNCPESCPLRVRAAVAALPFIHELGFDLDHEAVLVSFDAALGPAREVVAPLLEALRGAGYDPWLSTEPWPPDAQVDVMARPPRGPAAARQ